MRLDTELIIETPERVELRFALASVGTRFLAGLIDHGIQAALIALSAFALLATGSALGSVVGDKNALNWALAIIGLILFGVSFGYFAFFETLWSGQTPGKRLMKLRVVREDGRPITFFEAFVRNILRGIDFLPSGYAVGVVSIILTNEARRVGDFVAGTVVVKERASEAPSLQQVLEFHERDIRRNNGAVTSVPLDVRKLDMDEVAAVERFLSRRQELPPDSRPWIAARIAAPIAYKLNAPSVYNHEAFLEDVDRQYRAQAKYIVD
jgi:uncharacterized RDD family membrane protein YckC